MAASATTATGGVVDVANKGGDKSANNDGSKKNTDKVDIGIPIIDWSVKNTLFHKFFFAQVTKLISVGQIRRLEPEDLAHLPELESDFLHENFQKEWEEEKRLRGKNDKNLIKVLLRRHKFTFVWTGFLFAIAQGAIFAGPLLLREIFTPRTWIFYSMDRPSTTCALRRTSCTCLPGY